MVQTKDIFSFCLLKMGLSVAKKQNMPNINKNVSSLII
jgi:hypothetical protein